MANTVFNNKIIEAKAKDLLTTSVNTRNLMEVDSTLAACTRVVFVTDAFVT